MEFKMICSIFEDIRKAKTPVDKGKILEEYFRNIRGTQPKANIFALMRLMVPKVDRERSSYSLKESKIARVLVKLVALPPGNDKNILTKSYLMSGQASDFGDVVYSVIRKYFSNAKTTLTVNQLNDSLDKLANRSNEAEAEELLTNLFKKCAPEDSKWIIRIILKDLKLGIDGNRILRSYHKDAADYLASNNNLRKVCEDLYDLNANMHEFDIKVFEAFRPMLSKRVDAAVFKKHFADGSLYYTENKFDGERFQLHMDNGMFKYFSRNGFDYTNIYGSTVNEGIFTPKLQNVFQPFVKRIILDGEMMLWNTITNKYGSKGMDLDVKKLKDNGKYQPCFCVYDIILLNDKILTNKPLKDRLSLLERAFKEQIPGTIILSKVKIVSSRQEIIDTLNAAVEVEDEGIIVKEPNSIYKYSDRNSGWYKMKLEYFQDTMNDLDLILMGGQYASSTSNQLNSFIVGVKSGTTNEGKPIFLSFGKVSSGLNDIELDMINDKLKTVGKFFDNNHSSSLQFGKEIPDYYIEPENSLVFTVRASELTRANNLAYRTSYSLRFPRVVKVRMDKPVVDCLDINELLELTNKNKAVIKLNKRNIELEEILQIKTRQVKKKPISVIHFEDSRKVTDLFEGYTFYVFNGSALSSRDKTEAVIGKAGGNVRYKLDNNIDIVLVGTYDSKAKKLASKKSHFDVIDVSWLYRVIQEGNLLPYKTKEIYCLGTNIKNCLSDEVDRYGDSFTENATIETLKHSFEIMENLNETPCFTGMLKIIGRDFGYYVAYFDRFFEINNKESKVIYDSLEDELEFRYYSGKVCDEICRETNVIIINDSERKDFIETFLISIDRSDIDIQNRSFIYEYE
ncbi:DNA ligase 4 [Anthonomus grandis grandis]|uniref:DNA ligase 4 n=1 Tax=Anthonomus grandis grandis TaxID=2921223 RepID=UPI0021652767|nr:DNA ligase 4 [Anthonomus grandis grandis]XP_050306381.1 DNA ligase 4 [Anthonomus grandis grandis]XP_050306382.1 DNA ligase 4 [Anthonomus grandis grandis]XP_050306383.1 DNA ligase 4 [Anthonomus grandis grandis]XP_050306384.1 DNA ligase 4 [Anthonomus grandis grandis]